MNGITQEYERTVLHYVIHNNTCVIHSHVIHVMRIVSPYAMLHKSITNMCETCGKQMNARFIQYNTTLHFRKLQCFGKEFRS